MEKLNEWQQYKKVWEGGIRIFSSKGSALPVKHIAILESGIVLTVTVYCKP